MQSIPIERERYIPDGFPCRVQVAPDLGVMHEHEWDRQRRRAIITSQPMSVTLRGDLAPGEWRATIEWCHVLLTAMQGPARQPAVCPACGQQFKIRGPYRKHLIQNHLEGFGIDWIYNGGGYCVPLPPRGALESDHKRRVKGGE